MAEFCLQCSLAHFGEDTRDFACISSPSDTEKGLFAQVLCEGCGPTLVDDTGNCVSASCHECHAMQCPDELNDSRTLPTEHNPPDQQA